MNYNYINAHNTNTFSLEPDTEPTSFWKLLNKNYLQNGRLVNKVQVKYTVSESIEEFCWNRQ